MNAPMLFLRSDMETGDSVLIGMGDMEPFVDCENLIFITELSEEEFELLVSSSLRTGVCCTICNGVALVFWRVNNDGCEGGVVVDN